MYKITIQSDRQEVATTFDYVDVTCTELMESFIGMLVAKGFQLGSIEDFITEYAEYINDKNESNG